ncbi:MULTISPECIES: hypothetical protein [Bacteroides]|nr:hypothetical protein [Bacteroides neonati]
MASQAAEGRRKADRLLKKGGGLFEKDGGKKIKVGGLFHKV